MNSFSNLIGRVSAGASSISSFEKSERGDDEDEWEPKDSIYESLTNCETRRLHAARMVMKRVYLQG